MLDTVKNYQGMALASWDDLKTDACLHAGVMAIFVGSTLAYISDAALTHYYGLRHGHLGRSAIPGTRAVSVGGNCC